MKQNERDPRDLLDEHYLSDEQLESIFENYMKVFRVFFDDNYDTFYMQDDFLDDLCMWWAAYEIEGRAFYQNFVRNMLIPTEFIYYLRDYFINYKNGKYKKE